MMDMRTALAFRIVELAKYARDRQRTYFKGRSDAALHQSKKAEVELDRAIADFDEMPEKPD